MAGPTHHDGSTVASLGEDALVARLTAKLPQSRRTLTGPGDDCAVIQGGDGMLHLLKTDVIVEGRHFLATTRPEQAGWKALCRNISDIAAMGGVPGEALITIVVPPETTVGWLDGLYAGIRKAARQFKTGIAGGETSSTAAGQPIVISVSLLGSVETKRLVTRSGGCAGDLICVTGRLGGSIRGKHLTFTPRLAEARWLSQHFLPSAMMDLSDGLGSDLPRLAAASRCGFRIDPSRVPRTRGCTADEAMSDGEDYELLFTVPPAHWPKLARAWQRKFPKLLLSCIGELTAPGAATPLPQGWQHFVPEKRGRQKT